MGLGGVTGFWGVQGLWGLFRFFRTVAQAFRESGGFFASIWVIWGGLGVVQVF